MPFPFVEPAKFSLSSTNFTVDASITSDFGVFDDPLSLEYDSGATPPFSGGNDQFTVYYGTSGGGVESGGYCIIGVCP